MYTAVARTAFRRPRLIAALGAVLFVAFGVFGGPATSLLKATNSFEAPSSPSSREQALIERVTGAEPTAGVLALIPASPSSPEVQRVAGEIAAASGVAHVVVPPRRGRSSLVSRDGRQTLLAVSLRARADPDSTVTAIAARIPHQVLLGGSDVAGQQVGALASKDLGFAELIAFPLLTLLALLIFRGVAAVLPVAVGGVSVLGAFSVLRLVNLELSLSNFALNLVIGVGLGLAVDYSLLLIWRFREELSAGKTTEAALIATLLTAGRTVTFSALTVAAAMLTLTLFPQRFLISMGIGGAAVALVAAASAILWLPALLVLLAPRIGRVRPEPDGSGRWYRLAHAVMRRPILVAVATTAILLLIASPTLRVRWTGIDATVLPSSQSARAVDDIVSRDFPPTTLNPVTIAAHTSGADGSALRAYARRLRAVPGIDAVDAPRYLGRSLWELDAAAGGDPIASASQSMIEKVDQLHPGFSAEVGGPAAQFHDQRAAITHSLPLALIVLALVTVTILWLMTGSIVLPIKALLMNALTAGTATGVLVLIFQDGRLRGPLAYASQGGIEQTNFIVLVAVGFALSTDYGVLLLTRIKEARDAGHDNREAIALGLQRSGRIVSASAILLAVAIGAFATSQVVFLKEIGIGAVVAVLIDAFVVRSALVPSLMVLLGERNWWSPAPLRALHRRIGLSEGDPSPATGARTTPGEARKVVSLPVGD
jgi:uncharacterized membrane protein YdfJ with MMPL/SSD domain